MARTIKQIEAQKAWVKKTFGICCIYTIRNQETGIAYVGSTTNAGERWLKHIVDLQRGHGSKGLQAVWDVFGPTKFDFQICEVLSPDLDDEAILLREQARWDFEVSVGRQPYNIRPRGRGTRRGTQSSDETKKKISQARKGKAWWNNGEVSCRSVECPGPEWMPGRLGYKWLRQRKEPAARVKTPKEKVEQVLVELSAVFD